MPYFSSAGYDVHAVSLRGQGGSDESSNASGVAGSIASHAADVGELAAALPRAPVLVSHSFGGIIAQALAVSAGPKLAGLALLASVPPSGNSKMAARFLRRTPVKAAKITWSFISRNFERDSAVCRDTFFSDTLPEAELERFRARIAGSCSVRLLDLRALDEELPIERLPQPTPVFVLGAEDDLIVDREGVQETAEWAGADPVFVASLAHDVMLDTRWEAAAQELEQWLRSAIVDGGSDAK